MLFLAQAPDQPAIILRDPHDRRRGDQVQDHIGDLPPGKKIEQETGRNEKPQERDQAEQGGERPCRPACHDRGNEDCRVIGGEDCEIRIKAKERLHQDRSADAGGGEEQRHWRARLQSVSPARLQ